MTVDRMIARHLEARGGLEPILAIKTLRQRGTVTTPAYTVQIYGERKRPNLLRIEFTVEGVTGMEGWDGSRAWEYNPWKGMTQADYVTGGPAIALERGSEFDSPLINFEEKGHTVEYVDEDELDGRKVHNLKVTRHDSNIVYHYIDAESMLVARTVSVRHIHGQEPAETTTTYYDYRNVAGVLFPFRSVEYAKGGEHNEVFQWATMEANLPLDVSRFTLPPPEPKTAESA